MNGSAEPVWMRDKRQKEAAYNAPAPRGWARMDRDNAWLRLSDLSVFTILQNWSSETASVTSRETITTVEIAPLTGGKVIEIRGERAVELLRRLKLPTEPLSLALPDPPKRSNKGRFSLD
jgi:hypothetical protein